ncbi:MAG: AGE family epimerase/isomerase [Bacteroidota bacterium]
MTKAGKNILRDTFIVELDNILNYWTRYTVDELGGGFYGEVTNDNQPVPKALKGSVLNARILWSFSAAYNLEKRPSYLHTAQRALAYIKQHFIDEHMGGVYWSVTATGQPADTKKQIYALAFTIYGLSAYYLAVPDESVLVLAQSLYRQIEQHSFDTQKGGYLEAFTRDWQMIDDLRLSDKDANEKKTMNTHLHVLEAYTALYRIWPDANLGEQIRNLIGYFERYMVDAGTHHLVLFLDEDWAVKSNTVSYGHDIEASWLLLEAAEVLHDEVLINRVKALAVNIARASAEGLNSDGSMNYEYEPLHQKIIAERHWWAQAEAVVGYYNAFQISGEQHFMDKAIATWGYTRRHIIDNEKGEWFWGINNDGSLMEGYGKAGFWKCPYHNSRACIEMINRLSMAHEQG